jgi:O-antigen/teichoic acid export membrane protein
LIIVIITSFDGLNLQDYFLSLCISNFLGVVIGFYYLMRKFGAPIIFPELKITAEMLKYSLPIVVSSFGVAVSLGLDRVLIGRYVGLAELGYYGVAAKFGAIAAIAFYTVSSAITPIVYRAPTEPGVKDLIARLFYIAIALCLIAMFLIIIFSESAVVLIAGESFRKSAPLVFYIFTTTCISNMYIFFLGMDISKNTTRIGQINLAMGFSSTILSIILIPLIGIWGAIISGLIAASIRLALYIYYSQKLYKINVRIFVPFFAVFVMIVYNSTQILRTALD